MATIQNVSNEYLFGSAVYSWSPMKFGDVGVAVSSPGSGDRSFQVQGTFGAGTTVVVEGTLDPATVAGSASNWFPLRDPGGNSISFTAPGLKAILENCLALRPHVTVGDGTEVLTAIIVTRGPRSG